MNLTNDDALDIMVSIARQALERGKVDQALTILSGVVTKAPRHALAWFSMGRAQLAQGARDHAAMCYQRAATLAAAQQRGKPSQLLSLATDNMVLCGEKVLPPDWLPALQDPYLADLWGAAIAHLAGEAVKAAAAAGGEPQQPRPSPQGLVVGGLGLQALLLQALMARRGAAAAPAAPPAMAAAEAAETPRTATVIWVQPDELSRTVAAQMAAAAGLQRPELNAVNGWEAAAAAAAAAAATATPVSGAASGEPRPAPASGRAVVLVAAGMCTARLALREWTAALAQARPLLAPGALLSPSRVRLVGALVASEDLQAMNQVRLDWISEDTGGLQYGPANELLWRPARSMQVSNMRYSLLSEPFPLLPEITAQQLLLQPDQILGSAAAAAPGAPAAAAAATAAFSVRHEAVVYGTASGRADCVVCWTEYELAPGVWLSYAPHELQGRSDPPALCPHVWQRVQYLSARPLVEAGQPLVLQVTLSAGGDDVRVEYDEDVTAVQLLAGRSGTGAQTAAAAAAAGAQAGIDGDDGAGTDGPTLPPGEPLLPAGEPLGETTSDGSDDDGGVADGGSDGAAAEPFEHQGAAAVASAGDNRDGGTAPAAAGAVSQSGLILPYHMSMLNDRQRNRSYLEGIRGAVAEARVRHPDQPLVVLDVGAGTGLLSMMAARAGADCVIGCERELALAVTAGALVSANDIGDTVRVLQLHSKDLRVADPAPPSQPPPQPPSEPPSEQPSEQPSEKASEPPSEQTSEKAQRAQDQGREGEQEGGREQAAAAAAAPPAHLPRKAQLVVHEIFGTDPLSEHILPSLAQVQESLAAPDAAFLPSAFRIVAALGHSASLEQRMRRVAPPLGLPAEEAGEEAARLRRLLPAAAAAALQPWAPWKAELDLLRVPDLVLLTEPGVLDAPLLTTRPLPRAFRSAAAAAPLPRPTPLSELFRRHGPGGDQLPTGAARAPAGSASVSAANCVVYWFEADCGAGGWLSTQPGSASTYYGHWVQNVHFLQEPLPIPILMGSRESAGPKEVSAAAAAAARPVGAAELVGQEGAGMCGGGGGGAAAGATINAGGGGGDGETGAGAGDDGLRCADLRVLLTAECVMDRVKMAAEWVVAAAEGDATSDSGDEQ